MRRADRRDQSLSLARREKEEQLGLVSDVCATSIFESVDAGDRSPPTRGSIGRRSRAHNSCALEFVVGDPAITINRCLRPSPYRSIPPNQIPRILSDFNCYREQFQHALSASRSHQADPLAHVQILRSVRRTSKRRTFQSFPFPG